MSLIPTKTFSQYLVENPALYDGIDIDESTKLAITEWFGLRYVCDDKNFSRFFRRNLQLNLRRYNEVLRIETAKYDWFVYNYNEKLINFESTENNASGRNLKSNDTQTETLNSTRTPNLTETNGGSRTITRTPNLATTEEYTDNKADTGTIQTQLNKTNSFNGTTEDSGTANSTVNTTTSSNSNTKALNSSLPNSISFTGSSEGNFPSFNWKTASAMNESKGNDTSSSNSTSNGSNSTTTTTNNTTTDAGTTTQTNNLNTENSGSKTINQSGNETELVSDNLTKSYTGNETTTGNNSKIYSSDRTENINDNRNIATETKDIETGRNGKSPADVIYETVKVIYNTSSFEWLKEKLEVCFWQQIDLGGLV